MSSKFAIEFASSLQEFPDSHFCSQACFKANFATHKQLHAGRYDFDRAFDRGPNHYSKAWWKMSSIGFNAFWAHVCSKEIDQEIIDKAVGVCHNVRVMLSSRRHLIVDFVGQRASVVFVFNCNSTVVWIQNHGPYHSSWQKKAYNGPVGVLCGLQKASNHRAQGRFYIFFL